ncbi:histidine kinase [Mesotoga sp. Brook.08.YT.4.2.5.1]|uniref:Response regulator with CheY-like receiver domain and winged-helix DNA-binding domain n=1 Tax=Mesotoga prima TaxID=1184387 RepID=A0A117M3D5_9BACT|nr:MULTISPECIES: response regulator transcription factor [unclassified Mesotoga]KUK82121.1 MAG: Response regulator with CheY-like receiver domain and winged-helix DNA-binding domain [Mesotoga prima]PNE23270.1 histidine kinase [Mesotoga sp. Brook.08.YT.4.2.5.1]PNS42704.1 histidine kinase [Mesotoga sp. B105.6.4]PVD17295.1 PhoB family transcriptional regulator [Mesotoga sp. Brook.08.105.5.1]RAO98038.1 PhoB family transcriptional regulator [Mesotoga sp. Brook.08.YT.4.2.5.4.]
MKVLIVEDERDLGRLLKEFLEREGFVVETAADGEEGLYMATSGPFDVIVLDILLPKLNGWQVLEGIRSSGSKIPVLMLTALDGIEDKVKGFYLGADDYLSKPFDIRELVVRIQSLLRRSQPVGTPSSILKVGDLALDMSLKTVIRGNERIALRKKEYQILEYLMLNSGRVVPKSELEEHLWNEDDELWSDVIRSHIKNLRKKIDGGHKKKLIKTVRGMGYEISDR